MNAAAGGIQREFTDRNTHPADALIAQTKNTLAVGDDDHLNIVAREALQHLVNVMAVRPGNKQAAAATINFREVFAGFSDGWRINHRQHLFHMTAQ